MTKKLDEAAMQSELSGSAFFNNPPQPRPIEPTPAEVESPVVPAVAEPQPTATVTAEVAQQPEPIQPINSNEAKNEETIVRTMQRITERTKTRHSFDIFEDQLLSLREMVISRQKVLGDRVWIGELVQEALDALIKKERNKQ